MNNCARCLESNIETPAVYFARITEMYYAPIGKMISVDNDGATLCHGCLAWTIALPGFKLEYQDIKTWLMSPA
jgi:hypothetical protein